MAPTSTSSAPTTAVAHVPHQALYRRWRAQTFDQIVGQPGIVTTLRNAVRLDRLAHGFLFVGPRGTGKTSMARILAKAVNCSALVDGEPCDACVSCVAIREGRALDVVELDAASNNRVDDMRELLPRVYTAASDLRHKVFIIDEVQRIKEGWDVLLKTLEEPPDGVLFIFCTTDPSQIRPAVISRLQRFAFRPLSVDEIAGKLARILEADGRAADDDAIDLIARLAAGGMRDAESMLDQVLGSADERVTIDAVRDLLGLADTSDVDRFIDALASGDLLAGIAVLDRLEGEGRDLVSFADQVVARLRQRLVEALAGPDGGRDVAPARLARAARRLTGIDATRGGPGGYRWQLELALLQAVPETTAAAAPDAAHARTPEGPSRAAVAGDPDAPRGGRPGQPAPTTRHPRPPEPPRATPDTRDDADAPGRGPSVRAPGPDGPPAATRPAADQPAAAPPAADRADAPATEADAMLERLRREWPQVVAHVARNPANKPLIQACRPVEVRDGVVVLGFPEDQPFLREKAEQRRPALEEGLRQVLGRAIGVRCVSANVEILDSIAVTSDDLVAHARRIFGGDIVDVADVT